MTEGFIDIHCHALYGVDDGARKREESLAMLRLMYDEGIREAILTPHYHRGHAEADISVIRRHFAESCTAAGGDKKASAIKLHLGCELYYYPSGTEWIDEGTVATMDGSRFVLLEFGYTMDKRLINEGVSNVVRAGYTPVIAHVERYRGLSFKVANVSELIDMGALIQVNSDAVGPGFARERSFVRKLLKEDMVHFVATDAHDTRERAPKFKSAACFIEDHYGEECCRRIFCDNARETIFAEGGM